MKPLLEVEHLSKHFGGVHAVRDVSFTIGSGEIVGLIGPNGAGKTTLVNLLTGVHRPSGGVVRFEGVDVTAQRPHEAARRGLARTFQIVQPFPRMTVLENVAAGALFAGQAGSRAEAERLAAGYLAVVGLDRESQRLAATLTLPSRKRLELAKSLAMRPKLLLLDEVNAGLNTSEIDGALALIRRIAASGITVVLIEHLMKVVLSLSQRVLVLHHGQLLASGAPEAVMRDPQVVEAYLGARFAARFAGGNAKSDAKSEAGHG